jgi:NAD(P)H-flavin reductase
MTTPEAASLSGPSVAEAMLPRPFRVAARHEETYDTVTLAFEPEDGDTIRFAPGQFVMLYLFGIGEVPISISGGTRDGQTLVHTIRSVGAVTKAIWSLSEGDRVGIRGPYGVGWPVEEVVGKDLVVAAGGIGLAPLRSVVEHALEHRERFGAVSLIYGTRSPSDLLYDDELHEWRSRFDIDLEVTVDRSETGWRGDVGFVTSLLPRINYDPANTAAMVCGPEIMMKVVARKLVSRGVEPADVYVSLERNMKCAIGFCGHCQFGPDFVCRDGPVVAYARVMERMRVAQL